MFLPGESQGREAWWAAVYGSHRVGHDRSDLAAAAADASKVMLKILQARLQQYVNRELPDVKLLLEKAEEPETKLPTYAGSLKKQESSRKTSISALLTLPKPLTVWITINWKILKEMGIGQEATVRTGHGTIDWFQIGKGVCQGCILLPCYLTYTQSAS